MPLSVLHEDACRRGRSLGTKEVFGVEGHTQALTAGWINGDRILQDVPGNMQVRRQCRPCKFGSVDFLGERRRMWRARKSSVFRPVVRQGLLASILPYQLFPT